MKINKKKSVLEFVFITGVLLIMVCSFVSAIGFSFSHSAEEPLTVSPGGTTDTVVRIKTSPAEGNKLVKAELLEDAGIASITDSSLEYSVSPGNEGDGIVHVRLKAPSEAVLGSKYIVSIRFTEVESEDGGGMVGITQSSTANLEVLVQKTLEEEEISTTWIILGIVLIVAIIAVIWFMAKSKKE